SWASAGAVLASGVSTPSSFAAPDPSPGMCTAASSADPSGAASDGPSCATAGGCGMGGVVTGTCSSVASDIAGCATPSSAGFPALVAGPSNASEIAAATPLRASPTGATAPSGRSRSGAAQRGQRSGGRSLAGSVATRPRQEGQLTNMRSIQARALRGGQPSAAPDAVNANPVTFDRDREPVEPFAIAREQCFLLAVEDARQRQPASGCDARGKGVRQRIQRRSED